MEKKVRSLGKAQRRSAYTGKQILTFLLINHFFMFNYTQSSFKLQLKPKRKKAMKSKLTLRQEVIHRKGKILKHGDNKTYTVKKCFKRKKEL